jgi:hypothetical protein
VVNPVGLDSPINPTINPTSLISYSYSLPGLINLSFCRLSEHVFLSSFFCSSSVSLTPESYPLFITADWH